LPWGSGADVGFVRLLRVAAGWAGAALPAQVRRPGRGGCGTALGGPAGVDRTHREEARERGPARRTGDSDMTLASVFWAI